MPIHTGQVAYCKTEEAWNYNRKRNPPINKGIHLG